MISIRRSLEMLHGSGVPGLVVIGLFLAARGSIFLREVMPQVSSSLRSATVSSSPETWNTKNPWHTGPPFFGSFCLKCGGWKTSMPFH